jgi:hypothetical protein
MFVSTMPHRAPEGVRPTLSRSSRLHAIVVSLLVVGGGGFLVWRNLNRDAPEGSGSAAPAAAPPSAPAEGEPEPTAAAAAAAATAPAPATTQGLLEAVSGDGLLRKWLAEGDAVRRWAVVAANLALGESPRRELASVGPAGKFSVEAAGAGQAISPASYARYDAFGDAVASVDAGALASAWHALHPALQAAYRALGYPYPTVDSAMLRALRRLQQAPVRDGPVLVEADGAVWAFADPRLEALGPVEKHLLRMGPRNARLVQQKARELEAALGLAKPRIASERR